MSESTPEEVAEAAQKSERAASRALTAAETTSDLAHQAGPGRLARLNTNVTLLAALLSAVLGVATGVFALWLKAGEARLQEVEQKSKLIEARITALDERSKAEDTSYKFAREFLGQVKDSFGDSPRGKQLAVAALNIIAQASTSDGGQSSAHSRAELPLHMALLINDPGSLVMLDPELLHLNDWFDFASADAEDSTRVTAIQALCSLSKRAVQNGRLDRLEHCTNLVEQLLTFLAGQDALKEHVEDGTAPPPPTPEMTAALIAMTRLQIFFTEHAAQVQAAKLPTGDRRDPQAVMAGVRERYEKAVAVLQEVNHQLVVAENTNAPVDLAGAGTGMESFPSVPATPKGGAINKGYDPDEQPVTSSTASAAPGGQLQRTRMMVSDALQAVSFARQSVATSTALHYSAAADAQKAEIDRLINELLSDEAATRHHGHFNLALLRQAAVEPMVAALRQRENQPGDPANRLRLGVAVALSRMVQPITLQPDEAKQVVALLGAKDADTRTAATDFLVDVENPATVQNVFDAIQAALAGPRDVSESAGTVYNAAVVLGTWARVLPGKSMNRDGQPMRKAASATVAKLRDQLRSQDARGWAGTVKTIDTLLRQADPAGSRAATP